MHKKKVFIIDILILIVVLILGYTIGRIYYDSFMINSLLQKVNDDNYKKEISKLKEINEDVVGIIEIENIGFKTLFVQGKDNKEYLYKNIYKKKSRYGTTFLDYQSDINDKKIVIYGHSSNYVKMPFNILEKYYNKKFYKKNKIITMKTEDDIRKYELISVFIETNDWSYKDVKFLDDDDLKDNINSLIKKSIYKEKIKYKGEQILVLQTCSTNDDYKNYKRKYLVLVARRIEE